MEWKNQIRVSQPISDQIWVEARYVGPYGSRAYVEVITSEYWRGLRATSSMYVPASTLPWNRPKKKAKEPV